VHSRDGLSTKIHLLSSGPGEQAAFRLMGGQTSVFAQALPLLAGQKAEIHKAERLGLQRHRPCRRGYRVQSRHSVQDLPHASHPLQVPQSQTSLLQWAKALPNTRHPLLQITSRLPSHRRSCLHLARTVEGTIVQIHVPIARTLEVRPSPSEVVYLLLWSEDVHQIESCCGVS
jgi:hypothetical protein